jgi:hypothetical protein
MGSIDPMMDKQRKKLLPCVADHRLDEPTGLSLGMVASPQCPLPFRPARLIVAPTLSGGFNFWFALDSGAIPRGVDDRLQTRLLLPVADSTAKSFQAIPKAPFHALSCLGVFHSRSDVW